MTTVGSTAAIHAMVESYYTGKVRDHGATARGVDWKDERSHALRHRQFIRLIGDDTAAAIGDLGCGFGDFLTFLRAHGYDGRFVGYDLSEAMLEAARARHADEVNAAWHRSGAPTETTDYVVASGLFNVRGAVGHDAWRAYVLETIDGMAGACHKGFAFNVLSLHSDPEYRRPDLFYADPGWFLDHCARRYGRRVALLQDCGLYEFTLMVRLAD